MKVTKIRRIRKVTLDQVKKAIQDKCGECDEFPAVTWREMFLISPVFSMISAILYVSRLQKFVGGRKGF
jgi:hypothetical protein